jgi:hypothetical protein
VPKWSRELRSVDAAITGRVSSERPEGTKYVHFPVWRPASGERFP